MSAKTIHAYSPVLFCLITTTAMAQVECPAPNWSTPIWLDRYAQSIDSSEAVHLNQQTREFFDQLRVVPDHESITFEGWAENGIERETVTLDNPVLVATWTFTQSPASGPNGVAWENFKTLQRYNCNGNDNVGGNIWFTLHGNAVNLIRDRYPDGTICLDPAKSSGCQNAIYYGVPTVGVPYGFNDPDGDDPSGPWWRQFIMLAVVERDSLIRPSYNPTVIPNTTRNGTRDGVPIWDPEPGPSPTNPEGRPSYRLAREGVDPDDVFMAQYEAASDFVGYVTWQGKPQEYRGWEGLALWLDAWGLNSWDGADTSGSPYSKFPYTKVGLTWGWQNLADGEPLGTACSEFILKGEKPIYVIGTWEGAQYLTANQSDEDGMIPWCETCGGDLNMDGVVDGLDIGVMLVHWGSENPCYNISKTNRTVGADDLGLLFANWGPCERWPEVLNSLKPADQPCP